jgi:hypothetical protein
LETDIEKEEINEGLWWADHVFLGGNKLHDTVVQFCSLPSVYVLLCRLIPIESLRDIVGEITHVATPAVSMI